MHLEGGPKIGPPLAKSEEESCSPSEHTSGFSEAPAVPGPRNPVTETGRFLLRNRGRFLLHSTVADNRFLLLPILTKHGAWMQKKRGRSSFRCEACFFRAQYEGERIEARNHAVFHLNYLGYYHKLENPWVGASNVISR